MGSLAFLLCIIGIGGLFFLDRRRPVPSSTALWVPTVWMWIIGSRTPSMWMGAADNSSAGGLDATLEGNSTDAAVFTGLIAIGILVLLQRWRGTRQLLKGSAPIVIYFVYCLASVAWSPFPDAAFKRWTKAVGDLVMILIVVTDARPIEAIQRLISRVGFILLPASIVLIRYTPLGRGYDPDGHPMNTGVTTNKNTLGLITFVLTLGALWNVIALVRDKRQPDRGRRLLAQIALLAFGFAVLGMAQSATSIVCFALGASVMLLTNTSAVRRRPARMHAVVLTIALTAGIGLGLGLDELALKALGRDSNLTGRTEIWQRVIPMAQNPTIGSGFQSFWNSAHGALRQLSGADVFMFSNLSSAHNGYIETYLNLGWIGVVLIIMILISGYRWAGVAFRRNPYAGSLALAYLVTAAIYSITEAGFRMMTPTWIFLLLGIVLAIRVTEGRSAQQAPAGKTRDGRGNYRVHPHPIAWAHNPR